MKTVLLAALRISLLSLVAAGALALTGCETPAGSSTAANTNDLEALKTAANGGDADAAFKLGEIYRNGRGVPKNYVESETWHKKAIELFNKQNQPK
jgi:TPR repeat protein